MCLYTNDLACKKAEEPITVYKVIRYDNYSIVKNATMTFSIALLFILSTNIGKAMGDSGVLSPFTATFGPLILFLVVSIALISYRSRAR